MKRLFATALLALSSIAFGATLVPIPLINPAGSTSGQAIVSTGPSTAPAWGNGTASGLVAQAANTVVANVTAGSASPTPVAIPSCSAANSALKYTSATGFSCGTTYALTSSTLAQFAATTSAQLLGVISDETGSGALVFGTSPTIATPTINGAALSGTLSGTPTFSGNVTFTGLIQPTSTQGIKGTTTNDSPAAGSIGENPTNSTTATSMANNTPVNCTSVSLTAGNYLVFGQVTILPSAVPTQIVGSISTTSATLGSTLTSLVASFTSGANEAFPVGPVPLKFASTTTVFLVGQAQFASGTTTCNGVINAIRIR